MALTIKRRTKYLSLYRNSTNRSANKFAFNSELQSILSMGKFDIQRSAMVSNLWICTLFSINVYWLFGVADFMDISLVFFSCLFQRTIRWREGVCVDCALCPSTKLLSVTGQRLVLVCHPNTTTTLNTNCNFFLNAKTYSAFELLLAADVHGSRTAVMQWRKTGRSQCTINQIEHPEERLGLALRNFSSFLLRLDAKYHLQ